MQPFVCGWVNVRIGVIAADKETAMVFFLLFLQKIRKEKVKQILVSVRHQTGSIKCEISQSIFKYKCFIFHTLSSSILTWTHTVRLSCFCGLASSFHLCCFPEIRTIATGAALHIHLLLHWCNVVFSSQPLLSSLNLHAHTFDVELWSSLSFCYCMWNKTRCMFHLCFHILYTRWLPFSWYRHRYRQVLSCPLLLYYFLQFITL